MINALTAVLERLVGSGVAVAVRDIATPSEPLWPIERLAMATAVPARLAEFSAGRAAARAAMQARGLPKAAIPVGPDRAPQWPKGVVGSISHTNGICVAMVARADQVFGVGVDLEPDEPLDPALWAEVCTAQDVAYLESLPQGRRGKAARLIFSAKECTYKCIYPQIRTVLDFDAMSILPDEAGGDFVAKPMLQGGPFAQGTVLHGGYAVTGGLIATVMVLR